RRDVEHTIVNVGTLEQAFEDGDEVTPDTLRARGLIRKKTRLPVKVLGHGELTKRLTVHVDGVSATARQKITAAGGTVDAGR
ncbi:MAG TPA: uL15 family ribosomal protein, partial [Nitriliruptorales bacterium]|nr:uL15 family ribosomal protein [Nitriliruptorales bacterium]